MRRVVLGLLVCSFASAQSSVSFYFAAHQDDWQLFMNPNAYTDVQTSFIKTVFVYTTAGDAGLGAGTGGRKQPYYLARENGALVSTRFMADAAKLPVEESTGVVQVNGHNIYRVVYRSTVSYFLRLPDGYLGDGYESTGNQSLKRLRDGAIARITAVDGSASYSGWSDLVATLREILRTESGNASSVWANFPESNTQVNPSDHSDHYHTAYAVQDVLVTEPCVHKAIYVDYQTRSLAENLNKSDREIETGTFSALNAGLVAFDALSTWDTAHRNWLGRNYFRTEIAPLSCR